MKFLFLIFTVLSLYSCANTANTTHELKPNGDLLLTSVRGMNVASKDLTFTFNLEEKRISGKTGCNGFSAKYVRNENKISFHKIISTKMFCQYHMEMENKILSTLPEVAKFVRDGNEFLFFSENGNLLLTLKKYRNE